MVCLHTFKTYQSTMFSVKQGPILPDSLTKDDPESFIGNIEAWKGAEMPGWVKSAAKLLNGGSEGQDWTALAKKLGGYRIILVYLASFHIMSYILENAGLNSRGHH